MEPLRSCLLTSHVFSTRCCDTRGTPPTSPFPRNTAERASVSPVESILADRRPSIPFRITTYQKHGCPLPISPRAVPHTPLGKSTPLTMRPATHLERTLEETSAGVCGFHELCRGDITSSGQDELPRAAPGYRQRGIQKRGSPMRLASTALLLLLIGFTMSACSGVSGGGCVS